MKNVATLIEIVKKERTSYLDVVEKLADEYVSRFEKYLEENIKKNPDESTGRFFTLQITDIDFVKCEINTEDSVDVDFYGDPVDLEGVHEVERRLFGKPLTTVDVTVFVEALEKRGFMVLVSTFEEYQNLYPGFKV